LRVRSSKIDGPNRHYAHGREFAQQYKIAEVTDPRQKDGSQLKTGPNALFWRIRVDASASVAA
jgi:hypothetical protein